MVSEKKQDIQLYIECHCKYLKNCGKVNKGPQRYPDHNLWNLCEFYFIWERDFADVIR